MTTAQIICLIMSHLFAIVFGFVVGQMDHDDPPLFLIPVFLMFLCLMGAFK